jgi:hypothetical protein
MTEARRERSTRHEKERARRARPREERPKKSATGAVERGSERESERKGERDSASAEAEMKLARVLSVAAPAVTVACALLVGTLVSFGSGILVLAGGALFGTIAFFWASLRTLGGEAPLSEGFEQMTFRGIEAPDSPVERKNAALRGLKDLELEHALGKIDDEDYAELSARYREQAKAILREIDLDASPQRARAEEIAKSFLAKRGFAPDVAAAPPPSTRATPETDEKDEQDSTPPKSARLACPACKVSNERDAVYCKKCGARLSPPECPACATVNEPDAAFCKKCGKAMASTLKEASDAAS